MKKITSKKESITIMIPAYNKEAYVEQTINEINKIVKKIFNDYEIIIFDDCSTDKTYEIINRLSKKNSKIRIIRNKKNEGLGYNFRAGAQIAKKKYYSWFSAADGNDDLSIKSIETLLSHVGEADIITSYNLFKIPRPLYRTIISNMFTSTLHLLFGLPLKYYCGNSIFKTNHLKKIKMRTNSFAMQAEVLIQLIKKGYSYKEYPFIQLTSAGPSTMLRLKNIISVLRIIIILFSEIHFNKNNQNNHYNLNRLETPIHLF